MRAAQCWRLAVAAVLVVVSLPVAADPGGSRLATLGLEEGKAPSPEAVRELKQLRAERARRSRGVTPAAPTQTPWAARTCRATPSSTPAVWRSPTTAARG
jgi:hypothetical protein